MCKLSIYEQNYDNANQWMFYGHTSQENILCVFSRAGSYHRTGDMYPCDLFTPARVTESVVRRVVQLLAARLRTTDLTTLCDLSPVICGVHYVTSDLKGDAVGIPGLWWYTGVCGERWTRTDRRSTVGGS